MTFTKNTMGEYKSQNGKWLIRKHIGCYEVYLVKGRNDLVYLGHTYTLKEAKAFVEEFTK